MAGEVFSQWASAKDAQSAFNTAMAAARWEHGHGGYTGTIAEKNSFVFIGIVDDANAAEILADRLISERDPRIDDKWGPAGCIQIKDTERFLFFGWASA